MNKEILKMKIIEKAPDEYIWIVQSNKRGPLMKGSAKTRILAREEATKVYNHMKLGHRY